MASLTRRRSCHALILFNFWYRLIPVSIPLIKFALLLENIQSSKTNFLFAPLSLQDRTWYFHHQPIALFHMPKRVTAVFTSCNRFDLLEATLRSFFKFNTYPLEKVLIIEDSGDGKGLEKVLRRFNFDRFETIINPEQLGQQRSIEKAYSQVNTEYIFHCEDDWEFLREGFIEESLRLMEAFPKLVNIWGRDASDLPADFYAEEEQQFQGIRYREVKKEIFILNPTLKRLSDYKLMGSFTKYDPAQFEREISDFFSALGYTAIILSEPYMRNIGWHRRVHFRDKANKYLKLDNKFKRAKASVYKLLKIGKFKS